MFFGISLRFGPLQVKILPEYFLKNKVTGIRQGQRILALQGFIATYDRQRTRQEQVLCYKNLNQDSNLHTSLLPKHPPDPEAMFSPYFPHCFPFLALLCLDALIWTNSSAHSWALLLSCKVLKCHFMQLLNVIFNFKHCVPSHPIEVVEPHDPCGMHYEFLGLPFSSLRNPLLCPHHLGRKIWTEDF